MHSTICKAILVDELTKQISGSRRVSAVRKYEQCDGVEIVHSRWENTDRKAARESVVMFPKP